MSKDTFFYFFLRSITTPLRFMPYSWLRHLGKALGYIAYYTMRAYRKRTLSNLSLAESLCINSEKKLKKIAKESFVNLAINVLEYAKFDAEKDFSQCLTCENPEVANDLYAQGKGIIFFCGHQSNWEALFLDGTTRMKGIAIGKAIKNKRLYRWIVSIREKNGGTIVAPRNALKEGLRALKKGYFIGVVGDQGMPDSGYSFPFLGRRAWNSTAPALLAYRTKSPIIVASTRRTKTGYSIRYSSPIIANVEASLEAEVVRMMNLALTYLEESIQKSPGEWLWQHNRWKQQTPGIIHRRFRFDSIAIILPSNPDSFMELYPHLGTFREIYPTDFLFLFVPKAFASFLFPSMEEVFFYESPKELFVRDYRFKLVFNLTNYDLTSHFEKLSVFETLDLIKLKHLAAPHLAHNHPNNFSDTLKRALSRSGTLWKTEISHGM